MYTYENLYFTKGWKSTVQNLERFCSDTSKKSAQRVGRVLTSLIKKKYPKGKDSISFDELLDWGLWSSYIRIYCKQMFNTGVFDCLRHGCPQHFWKGEGGGGRI